MKTITNIGGIVLLGFSVYLSNIKTDYIKKMLSNGFNTIFTSLQIPEEHHSNAFEQFKELKSIVGDKATVIVDINPSLFDYIESELNKGINLGLDAIRFDESVDIHRIVAWSHHSKVVLNASTDGLDILRQLKGLEVDYSNVIVMHNYYPRPETGLDDVFFMKQNQKIKEEFPEIRVMAFICGSEFRGPVYKGLPTVENHRAIHPLIAYKEMLRMNVDIVVIGDTSINDVEINQFSHYILNNTVRLRAEITDDYDYLYELEQNNRLDLARDVVRSEFHRKKYQSEVKPSNCVERIIGSITIDNKIYGRYMNELQITKRDLPKHEAVNVIGRVVNDDLNLIELIGSGTKFKFVRE